MKNPLTIPSKPLQPGLTNNENGDLIIYEDDFIKSIFFGGYYIFKKFIGGGAFGKVYLAINTITNKEYAIKISSILTESKFQCKTEKLFIKTLNESNCPNIIELIEYFEISNHIYLIEPFSGQSLFQILVDRNYTGFPLLYCQIILRDIIKSFQIMHKKNIIHTDIKPENILINGKQIILIDFGGAIIHNNLEEIKLIQSLYYRSPEIILGLPFTSKIDIWSLGCVLIESFIGLPIFAGFDDNHVLKLIEKIIGNIHLKMIYNSPLRFQWFTDENILIQDEPLLYQSDFEVFPLQTFLIKYFSPILEDPLFNEGFNEFIDLIKGMLQIDPDLRFDLNQIINHPFYRYVYK